MFKYFNFIIVYIIIKKYDRTQKKKNLKLCYNKNVMRLNSKENEKNMIEFIKRYSIFLSHFKSYLFLLLLIIKQYSSLI